MLLLLQWLIITMCCETSHAFTSPSDFLASRSCTPGTEKVTFDHRSSWLNRNHPNNRGSGSGQHHLVASVVPTTTTRNFVHESAVSEKMDPTDNMGIENSSDEDRNEKPEQGGTTVVVPVVVESTNHVMEMVAILSWLSAISGFTLINNNVGPWPSFMIHIPERIYFLLHMVGGVAFGGGIILTTAIEWLVANEKNKQVLRFWFEKVPILDYAFVLPGLTVAMISGIGLTIVRYDGLGLAPIHIKMVFWTLIAFASWWSLTDLTTQGSALQAIQEWEEKEHDTEVPEVVTKRTISNVVSCIFVVMLYVEMVLKPGTLAMKNF